MNKALILLPPLFVSVILHEVAHGYAAEKLGDPTARRLGRISLNPIAHIDLFMTILMPATLLLLGSPFVFGGAKPVPVNPLNFRNPRRGMALVALAGPLTNFAIVALLWPIARYAEGLELSPEQTSSFLLLCLLWLYHGIIINLVLGFFNLLPVPPLDGGRILVGFLPLRLAARLARIERWGLLIVIALLMSGVVEKILGPILTFFTRSLLGIE